MTARARIAGAPITWGISEVPGWGVQLPAEHVLGEMHALGLAATELGPDGYLPQDPQRLRALLGRHELRLVGGFVTAVLHEPSRLGDELASVERQARQLAAGGGDTLVMALVTGEQGYDRSARLDAAGWDAVSVALTRVAAVSDAVGLRLAVHPHVGTLVELADDVATLLERTDAGLCLDTGHLVIGGADVVELARTWGTRVAHVHLKDVDLELARAVRAGEIPFRDGVRRGMFVPLGTGGVPAAEVVALLEQMGYAGWYVLEQDTVLSLDDDRGRPRRDAARSLEAILSVLDGVRT